MEIGAFLEEVGASELIAILGPAGLSVTIARSWDPDIDWSRFNTAFETDSLPCREPMRRAVVVNEGFDVLERLMREGRHQMMRLIVEPRLGMRAALFVHSSVLGRNNGLHALRAGGFRRHGRDEPEHDVFRDGLNLARAMSYKNAAADLPLGGCKMTVQCDPIDAGDLERLGFLAYAIESGRFLTGPDMGFLPEHADVMRSRFTRHVTGGRSGALGPTGGPTALGCALAIREAAAHALGSADLEGRVAAIQGLGAVGFPLAVHLRGAGMKLVVADVSPAAIDAARAALGEITVVSPDRILAVPCDILAPCAFGGVLDDAAIDRLACKMIYGSANNPLKATSVGEELRLAERIAGRGILFQIEWTHNTAGVMAGFEEYIHGDEATLERLRPRLERVCREGTRRILERAAAEGKTPTRVAYEEVDARIY
jgi:glutamate dehydrogenase/leucine dehydrogenase